MSSCGGSSDDEGETFMIGKSGGSSSVLANVLAFKENEEAAALAASKLLQYEDKSGVPQTMKELLFQKSSNDSSDDDGKDEVILNESLLAAKLVSECALPDSLTDFEGFLSKDTKKYLFARYLSFPLLPLARVLCYGEADKREIVIKSFLPNAAHMLENDFYKRKLWLHKLIEESSDGKAEAIDSANVSIQEYILQKTKMKESSMASSFSFSPELVLAFSKACKKEGIYFVSDLITLDLLLGKKAWKYLSERIIAAPVSGETSSFALLTVKDWFQKQLASKKHENQKSSESVKGGKKSMPDSTSSSSSHHYPKEPTMSTILPIVQPNSARDGILSRLFSAKADLKLDSSSLPSQNPSSIRPSNPSIEIHPTNPNKIIVQTSKGSRLLVDRWCPHKKADLAKGYIESGDRLICPKHKWAFDLTNGGMCKEKKVCVSVCSATDLF